MTMNITQTKIYKTREIIKRRKIRLIIFYKFDIDCLPSLPMASKKIMADIQKRIVDEKNCSCTRSHICQ